MKWCISVPAELDHVDAVSNSSCYLALKVFSVIGHETRSTAAAVLSLHAESLAQSLTAVPLHV